MPIVLNDNYSSTFNGSLFFKSIFGLISSRLELEKKFSGATVFTFWNLEVEGPLSLAAEVGSALTAIDGVVFLCFFLPEPLPLFTGLILYSLIIGGFTLLGDT